MALQSLPARRPETSLHDICAARLAMSPVMTDEGSVSPAPLELIARVIEGHPDDLDTLEELLGDARVRHALLVDIEIDDGEIGPRAIKVLSAVWAAAPSEFEDGPAFSFDAVHDHVVMLRNATSNHARMEMIGRDPDLRAILARDWRKPFHGHVHKPGPIGRLRRALQALGRRRR